MKKIMGLSIETNIGCLIIFLGGIFIFLTNHLAGSIITLFTLIFYFGMSFYFLKVLPNRPFFITLASSNFNKGDIIYVGRGKSVIVIEVSCIENDNSKLKVKPYKFKPFMQSNTPDKR